MKIQFQFKDCKKLETKKTAKSSQYERNIVSAVDGTKFNTARPKFGNVAISTPP